MTLVDFGETLSQRPLGEVCAGGVSKHQKATCDPRTLLFFTIPNFRTGGRVRLNAPACRAGVPFCGADGGTKSFPVHQVLFAILRTLFSWAIEKRFEINSLALIAL